MSRTGGTAADPRDDATLLAAFRAGDHEAFGVLFRRHRDRLWAVALRTTGNPEDAADALQDAMIAAYRRADGFRGDARVTTWLHRIVVNACLDRLRRNKVRAADPLPDSLDEYAARGAVLANGASLAPGAPEGDPHGDPESAALARDQRNRVLAALDQLPPEQKAALVLVDMEAYPVQEAARILDCPTGTVKSRCSRGRARLAELLGDLRPDPTAQPGPDPAGGRGTGRAPAASQSVGPPADQVEQPRGGAAS